jgi:hypothetical protein
MLVWLPRWRDEGVPPGPGGPPYDLCRIPILGKTGTTISEWETKRWVIQRAVHRLDEIALVRSEVALEHYKKIAAPPAASPARKAPVKKGKFE